MELLGGIVDVPIFPYSSMSLLFLFMFSWGILFFILMPGIEPGALYVLGKRSATNHVPAQLCQICLQVPDFLGRPVFSIPMSCCHVDLLSLCDVPLYHWQSSLL